GGGGSKPPPNDGSPAVISILDATVTEGAASNGTTITMTNPDGVFCRLAYATQNGSALAPADFTAVQGDLVQISAVANTPLPLTIADDALFEANETFQVIIALAAGSDARCQLAKSVATITIASDDQASVVSIASATISEATGGQALVSMTNPTGRTCNVTVTSVNGTATAPEDFTAVTGLGVTLAGAGSVPVNLTTVNDILVEPAETFTLTIALAPGSDQQCQLGTATATITITSEDLASVISIADATVTEGAANNLTTISMTNATGVNCRLSVTTANGTAVAPGDYTAINGATFDMNAVTSATLNLAVVDDVLVETNETFTINLALVAGSDPRCQIGDGQATITVVSNDAFSVISIADVTVAEGAIAQVPVTMTNPTGVNCSLSVTTTNGTAVAPADYTAISGALFAVNGVASVPLPVTTADDFIVEASETFTVGIALATGSDPRCQIGDGTATVTITSADAFAVVSIGDFSVPETGGTALVPVTMTNFVAGLSCPLTVTTANGTATSGLDYNPPSSTFTIGAASANLGVPILDDTLIEPNETFTVTVALAAGADPRCQLGDGQATVTIVSNDVAAVISIADATVAEAAGADQTTISMTNFVAGLSCPLTVTTSNGTAVAPGDFAAKSAEAFTLDAASKPLAFTIVDDTGIETAESFTVTIALGAGADSRCQIGDATATITIVSDDAAAVISIADATVTEAAGADQTLISMTNAVAGLSCPLTVTTTNGTAVAPGDFAAKTAEAFTMDAASKALAFTIVDDVTAEGPETFTVTIALAGGADSRCQIGDATATITINSNE
ncbi:MAG: hypothetical protein JNJ42_14440, partial [Burkholderiaceae bacterium]|nr:hypothetical protein [Burkholderiaceae bacterium]